MSLDEGVPEWARALTRLAAAPRYAGDASAAVAASAFSIENSAARLAALYAGRLEA
jgi:hypothetical protein